MNSPASCSFSFLVSHYDLPFMDVMLTRLIRALHYPFHKRMLIVDTELLRKNRQHVPLDTLLAKCHALIEAGLADALVETSLDPSSRRQICLKHFGRDVRETRDFRGIPLLAWILPFEHADAPYLLHFDSDVFFHQSPSNDWVGETLRLIQQNQDVLCISPYPGPTRPDGVLIDNDPPIRPDPPGLRSHKVFSSRRFLVDRARWQSILPLTPAYTSQKRRIASWLTGRSAIWNWEHMAGRRIADSPFFCARTTSPDGWSLHAADHGSRFVQALPEILSRIDANDFPPAQAGTYDLDIDLWTPRSHK